MSFQVIFHPAFEQEFDSFDQNEQDTLLACLRPLQVHGFNLGRPYVDTLQGSRMKNLKEMRATSKTGEWRVAFAFDVER
jgi:hypothetical protein